MQPQQPQNTPPEAQNNPGGSPTGSGTPFQDTESQAVPPASGQVFTPGGSSTSQPASSTPSTSQPTFQSPAATSSETLTSQSVAAGSSIGPENSGKKGFKPSKKLVLFMLLPLFLLVGGGVGAYFGYYVPNKPENVWRTALNNTGKGYDKMSEAVTNSNYDKGMKIDSKFKFSAEGMSADGSFKGSFDDKNNGSYTGSLSASGLKIDFDLRTLASSTSNPDIYFKINGLEGLGNLLGSYLGASSETGPEAAQFMNTLNGINGQWYFVDHSLLDQPSEESTTGLESITKKDVSDFLKAIGDPTKKYVFTSNESNMAVEVKQQVGKEKQDGLSVYHYKAGINKTNLKKWNKEVCDNLKSNNLYKTLSFGQDQASLEKECYDTKDIDEMDSSRTADVWVDLRSKVVHKVRFTDSKNASNYWDIIQNYKDGDKVPFVIAFAYNDSGVNAKGLANIDYDMKSSELKVKGNVNATGEEGGSGNFELTMSPNTSEVKVEKPQNAKNIMQLVNDLGFGELLQGSSELTAPPTLQ